MFRQNSESYLSHETISVIFSEQLRRLPIKGGGEFKGSPKLILTF